MKKLLYIVGGLAVFFTVGLFLLLLFTLSKMELDSNRAKTAAARANRWPDKKTLPPDDLNNEKDVDKFLDQINNEKKD